MTSFRSAWRCGRRATPLFFGGSLRASEFNLVTNPRKSLSVRLNSNVHIAITGKATAWFGTGNAPQCCTMRQLDDAKLAADRYSSIL